MVSSDIVLNLLKLLKFAPIAVSVYAAYWAFDIRHALAIRVYKNQALGVGLLSLLNVYLILLTSIGATQGPNSPLIGFLELLFGVAGFLGSLYFVDASVLASRRSDPLFRDTFHWSKVRYLLWTWEIFGGTFVVLDYALSLIAMGSSFVMQIMNSGSSVIFPFIFLVPISTFLILFPVAIRAKDPNLKKHFKWLGLLAVLELVYVGPLGGGSGTGVSAMPGGVSLGIIFLCIGGFCLYKSARSLVTLNRLSAIRDQSGTMSGT
jgi:hypothetical protein